MAEIDTQTQAKNQIITKVVDYLTSEQAEANFTAGHLKKAIDTVQKSESIADEPKLNGIVQDFVNTLGPKSIEALDERKTIELSKSIGRSIISKVNPNKQEPLNYNAAEHQAALANFKQLDQSKFDLDGVNLATDIKNTLTEHAEILNANKKLNPAMIEVILTTQLLNPKDIEGKKEVITSLTAGMIAKTAGQQNPFQTELNKTGTLPANVTSAILSAAVDIANKPEYSQLSPEQAMLLGKQIGKQARYELHQNQNSNHEVLKEALTSKCQKSYAASIVPPTLIEKLAQSLSESFSSKTSNEKQQPRKQNTGQIR